MRQYARWDVLAGAVSTLIHAPCSALREMRAEQQNGVSTGGVSAGSDTSMTGCDDLRVEHQSAVHAFSRKGNVLILQPALNEWRGEPVQVLIYVRE